MEQLPPLSLTGLILLAIAWIIIAVIIGSKFKLGKNSESFFNCCCFIVTMGLFMWYAMSENKIEEEKRKDPVYQKQQEERYEAYKQEKRKEYVREYNALTPEQKLRRTVDEIRENDNKVRKEKGLPPRDKEYYDNMYKTLKNL